MWITLRSCKYTSAELLLSSQMELPTFFTICSLSQPAILWNNFIITHLKHLKLYYLRNWWLLWFNKNKYTLILFPNFKPHEHEISEDFRLWLVYYTTASQTVNSLVVMVNSLAQHMIFTSFNVVNFQTHIEWRTFTISFVNLLPCYDFSFIQLCAFSMMWS